MTDCPIALHHIIWLILSLSFSSDLPPTPGNIWQYLKTYFVVTGWCDGPLLSRDCWPISYNAQSSPPHRGLYNLKCHLVQKLRKLRLFPFTSHTFFFFPQKWVIFWILCAGRGVDWPERTQHRSQAMPVYSIWDSTLEGLSEGHASTKWPSENN